MLRQATVVGSGRYENCGVLCTARIGRNGQRQEQEVQNRRLRHATVVWSGRYENCGVLCSHAPDGMVDVNSRKCRTRGCGRKPSFGVGNTRTAEFCAQHAILKCGVGGYREGEVDLHNSGKETIGNIRPNGVKCQTVHSPANTSPPSEGSQGSRKRERCPEVTSSASMRPISRESVGGAGTMQDIDWPKTPVKRDSSVKAEVLLSL
ncbi:unnamed protein product [Ascophyllum nodosum]